MDKGYTVQKDVILHRCVFKVVSCQSDSDYFIAVLKKMRLWFPTQEKAQKRCDQNTELYSKPIRNWGPGKKKVC